MRLPLHVRMCCRCCLAVACKPFQASAICAVWLWCVLAFLLACLLVLCPDVWPAASRCAAAEMGSIGMTGCSGRGKVAGRHCMQMWMALCFMRSAVTLQAGARRRTCLCPMHMWMAYDGIMISPHILVDRHKFREITITGASL